MTKRVTSRNERGASLSSGARSGRAEAARFNEHRNVPLSQSHPPPAAPFSSVPLCFSLSLVSVSSIDLRNFPGILHSGGFVSPSFSFSPRRDSFHFSALPFFGDSLFTFVSPRSSNCPAD